MEIIKQAGTIIAILALFFAGAVWADSNGVWVDASDIRGGTFGGDEAAFTANYIFENSVDFNAEITTKDITIDSDSTLKTDVIESSTPGQSIVIRLG